MYLSLATHDARVAAPVGTGGASALAGGSHLNSYLGRFLLLIVQVMIIHWYTGYREKPTSPSYPRYVSPTL